MKARCASLPYNISTTPSRSSKSNRQTRQARTWRPSTPRKRGNGRMFYFRPGHETYPTYHDPNVLRALANAIRPKTHSPEPLEPLSPKSYTPGKAGIIKA